MENKRYLLNRKAISRKICLSFLAITMMILVACSNDDDTLSSKQIIAHYPEKMKQDIEGLPKDFRDNIVVPSLPKSFSPINFTYASEPTGKIINTTFIYAEEKADYHIVLNTMYGDVLFEDGKSNDTVTLDNGVKAQVIDKYELRWVDENNNYQELSFVMPDGTEANVTQDDLVKIANTME